MKTRITVNLLLIVICSLIPCLDNAAAASGPDRLSAKKEADAKGYTFFLSRDEIVAKAKQEGKLRAFSRLRESMNAVTEAFKKKYPFIETRVEDAAPAQQPPGLQFIGELAPLERRLPRCRGWDLKNDGPANRVDGLE